MNVNEPTLIVTGGPLDGQVVRVSPDGPTRLGSGPDMTVPLALANVAAHHASLMWDGHGLLLSALDTPTGTYVNGERISAEHQLADGDRVCLGPPGSKQSVKFVVRLEAGDEGGTAGDALPDFEAPAQEFDGTLDLSGPEPPPLVLIDPDAGADGPVAPDEARLPSWSGLAGEPDFVTPAAEGPAAVPAPAAPAPAAERPRTEARRRPEYTSDVPSMVPEPGPDDEPRARPAPPPPLAPPAVARPKAAPARRPPATISLGRLEIPRVALFAGLALVAGLATWLVARQVMRPAPVLESVLPPRVQPGGTITLSGSNFAPDSDRNEVRFGSQRGQVSSASETRITVQVPDGASPGGAADVPVSVVSAGRRSNTLHVKVFVPPNIKSIEPDVALPGAEVVLSIPSLAAPPTVVMDGQRAEVLEVQGGDVRVRVPDLPVAFGRKVTVVAEASGFSGSAGQIILGRLPLLTGVEPGSGPPGTPVKVAGRGFGAEPAANTVTVGGEPALVISASPRELVVAVPLPGGTGTVTAPIEVRVGGVASNALPLVVNRLSTLTFVLRFFPAPVPGDSQRAYVATELGPLLLLSDKGPAASVAERAVQLSSALNQLADKALAGQAPAFELRESPGRRSAWWAGPSCWRPRRPTLPATGRAPRLAGWRPTGPRCWPTRSRCSWSSGARRAWPRAPPRASCSSTCSPRPSARSRNQAPARASRGRSSSRSTPRSESSSRTWPCSCPARRRRAPPPRSSRASGTGPCRRRGRRRAPSRSASSAPAGA